MIVPRIAFASKASSSLGREETTTMQAMPALASSLSLTDSNGGGQEGERQTTTKTKTKIVLVCMRGGLRSSSIAWYLHRAGLDVEVLAGGYKAFKQWARGLWTTLEEEEKAGVEPGASAAAAAAPSSPSTEEESSKPQHPNNRPEPLPAPPPPRTRANKYKICVVGGRTGCGTLYLGTFGGGAGS
jgi:hypothetical protein